MHKVMNIPFYITISEEAPFTHKNKVHVGEVSAADLEVTLTAIDDRHVEYRSPFGGGGTTVRYLREGLLGIHIVHDSQGAHHWPSVQPGAKTTGLCWDCRPLGCQNQRCGGQVICNGRTCPSV